MSGLFGFISNSPALGAAALDTSVGSLDLGRADSLLRWGIGLHHEGDVLLRRRPADARSAVPLRQILSEVRATSLVGHFGKAPPGSRHTEDTYPCRYRQWLYAHCGVTDGGEGFRGRLRERLPTFLRANLQSDTTNELLFRLFLSSLHDAGGLLDGRATAAHVTAAVRSYVAAAGRCALEAGVPSLPLNLLVSNGDILAVARSGGRIGFRLIDGPREVDMLLGDRDDPPSVSGRTSPHVALVYSDPAHAKGRFIDIAPGTVMLFGSEGPAASATLTQDRVHAAA